MPDPIVADKIVYDYVLPAKTGCLAFVKPGEILRITDMAGLQVVDMAVFNRDNPRDKLSTSYSRTRYKPKPGEKFVPRDKLLPGDILLSTICTQLMRIRADHAERDGVHPRHPSGLVRDPLCPNVGVEARPRGQRLRDDDLERVLLRVVSAAELAEAGELAPDPIVREDGPSPPERARAPSEGIVVRVEPRFRDR